MSEEQHEERSGKLLGPYDVGVEQWREYEFGPSADRIIYRIEEPSELYFRERGTTHRVVDADGVTHCVPAPGREGCILRWCAPGNEVGF